MQRPIPILHHYLYHTKLARKFLYLILSLLFIEIIVFNLYFRNSADLLSREIRATSKQFLEQYIDNINYRTTRFNTLLGTFSTSEIIRESFSKEKLSGDDYLLIEKEIRQILNNQFPYGLYDLTFYPIRNEAPAKSCFIKSLADEQGSWKTWLEEGFFDHFFLHTEGSFNTRLFSILKPVYASDGDEIVCIIKLSLFPEKVFKAIKGVSGQYSHQLFIIDTNGAFVYGSSFLGLNDYLTFLHSQYDSLYNGMPIDDFKTGEGIYLTSSNSASGYRAVYYFSFDESQESVDQMSRTLTVGIIVLILITCTAVFFLSHSVNLRFNIVINKIKQVGRGDLRIVQSEPGRDEIGIFDTAFTQMVQEVKQLIETNYVSEMRKKDAEFMALQAQINPHFLFNSLEIINSLIELEQYDTACEANARLSSLLRYSINHNSSGIVTLKEEIAYMNDYIYIQKIRFPDKFEFHIAVDPSCLSCHIIKLVFQPFIENCIKHGLHGIVTGGHIWFEARDMGTCLLLSIRDNGNGMNEDSYQALLYRLRQENMADFQEQNESIGIMNIHYRLKLKYGNAYHPEIITAQSKGMTITLTIPRT